MIDDDDDDDDNDDDDDDDVIDISSVVCRFQRPTR